MDPRARLLRAAFDAAVDAARPERWLAPRIEDIERPAGRVRVLALGKAAAPMAEVFASRFDGPWDGLLVAPRGEGRPVDGFRVMEGAHPVPDEDSLAAGEAALAFAAGARRDDLLLVLLSGGASALACAPIDGVGLALKAETTRRLLASGAAIGEINTVRRACSRLKGGGLARAAGTARILTLAMSDVPDDLLADIGSGPAVVSPTTATDAQAVLRRRAPDLVPRLAAPMAAWARAAPPIRAQIEATVAFPLLGGVNAAADTLAAAGWRVESLGALTGEARETGVRHARLALQGGARVLLSGGELVVSLDARAGHGGRNQTYLLALAAELAGRADVWALAADTDGRDGSSTAAGAVIDPALLAGLDAGEALPALEAHDAHGFFERHRRLFETGPTGVNVGDFRAVLVDRRGAA